MLYNDHRCPVLGQPSASASLAQHKQQNQKKAKDSQYSSIFEVYCYRSPFSGFTSARVGSYHLPRFTTWTSDMIESWTVPETSPEHGQITAKIYNATSGIEPRRIG